MPSAGSFAGAGRFGDADPTTGGDRIRATVIGLSLLTVFIAARVLIAIPRFRGLIGDFLRRRWARVLERLDPPSEPDELAQEMRMVIRGEKLRADVRRVQRLLVTDSWMPATRQVGNRIAYDWLVRELDRYNLEVSELLPDAWNLAGGFAVERSLSAPSIHRPATPQVEVLEIGWKR